MAGVEPDTAAGDLKTRPLQVLFVEDREDDAFLVIRELRNAGFDVQFVRVETEETMQAALYQREWDLIVSDFSMPRFSGPAALEVLKRSGLDLPFIIVSGTVGEETAVTALKAGANDFLSKQNLQRLVPAVERELREVQGRRERVRAEAKLRESEAAQRELEEQVRQAQKMEAIGRLAGGVAHDFNNILTAIQGYASLTLADMPPESEHYNDIQEILDAAEWAASFTRQLLTFSRKQVTKPELLDANLVVADLRRLLSRVIGDQFELELHLSDDVGGVFMDRGQLEQVVMNLVVNARDAMPSGGQILVRTMRERGRPQQPTFGSTRLEDRYTVISVSDTGHGIPPELVARIFEPFFTTKEAGKGTGLGLSTVYGIVTQNDGFLTVSENEAGGTDFSVFLPERDSAPVIQETSMLQTGQTVRTGSTHCLVVEDEVAVRRLLQRTLERAGFVVHTAEDSAGALMMLHSNPDIEVLITDLMLPGMSGLQLIAEAMRVAPHLRPLLISGYSAEDVALSPGYAFLEKPFTPEDLLAAIRAMNQNPSNPA